MHVGCLRIELFISDSNSLKDKRSVVKALKEKVRNNFNVSVAEVDHLDKWQKAAIAAACVSSDKNQVNSVLDNVLDFVRSNGRVQVLDFEIEII